MIATQLVINRLPSYPIRHTQIKIKGLSKVSRISTLHRFEFFDLKKVSRF